ncbi:MAG: hypothetical protein GVY36_07150 [Verrucomicrobia bacterium]|nr:hypothetical protein [Verrucomicrobiota bacterium]
MLRLYEIGGGYDLDKIEFVASEASTVTCDQGTDKLRVVWADDPATTATIAWNQIAGNDASVHWGPVDFGTSVDDYPNTDTVDRSTSYKGMENRFVRLTGLTPETEYYFVLRGDSGTSPRYWFKTAPDQPEPFSFIAGGDSRNNQTPRRNANLMVSKLRPLFVFFTGDMTDGDSNAEWAEWFDDWQLTIAEDGRVFPIVPVRGNHENSNQVVYNLFDLTNPDNYYALSFGGDLARLYSLNSEMPTGGAQRAWLESDLQANADDHTWLLSGYHKPMRPHTSGKSEGSDEYNNWAQLFYDYGMDLVADSDSHVMKRTYPIRPDINGDEGFVRDDVNGTVYIGEGCWGAPLRSANDAKSWTRATASFNGFDWVFVYPDRIEARTVRIDNAETVASVTNAAPFALPQGIDVWAPGGDAVVQIPFVAPTPPSFLIQSGDEWKYLDDGSDQGIAWRAVDFDDSAWPVGTTEMGYGDGDESTVLSFGPDPDDKHITTYFRKSFRIYQPFDVAWAQLEVLRDDGVVVYLNGSEIARDNMPDGPINSETFSSEIIDGSAEDQFIPFFIDTNRFNPGHNVIAVEIHNRDGFSSDMSFDLKLSVGSDGPVYELTYEGYRQVTFDSADSNQAADDDHDGDLLSNLHEFFFGTNAKDAFSVRPSPVSVAKEGESMAFSFIRHKDTAADWTYLFSNDLVGWGELTEGTDYFETVDSVEASDVETVTLEFPNVGDRLFLQIVVTQ